MGQSQPRRAPVEPDVFSDPFAGEPLRGEAVQPDAFSDPYAGEPLRVATRSGRQAQDVAAGAAPSIGGMAGGLAGGIPGAFVGGAAGKGYGELIAHGADIPGALVDVARNLINEPMATIRGGIEGSGDGAIEAAQAGGLQGISEFAGGKVAQAGGVMAKWLMNRATTRVTEKLMREFPDLSDTLIDNALTVSSGGYEKAKGLLTVAKKKATAALQAADAAGAVVPVQMTDDVAESLKTALLEDAIKSRGIPASQGAVTAASNRLPAHLRTLFQQIDQAAASGGPLDLTASQADLLKRRLQSESKILYAQRGAPNGPKAMGMDATERAELAAQLNAAIDNVATGYKAGNAEAQPLIGAVRGIKQAIRPNGNLYQAMVRPAVGAAAGAYSGSEMGLPAWAGAMGGAALTSPAGMSREAILLANPKVQAFLKQLPRASALAFTELLGELSRTPEPTQGPQAVGRR